MRVLSTLQLQFVLPGYTHLVWKSHSFIIAMKIAHEHQSSYQVSGVVVGEGFRFGYKAKGDTETLQQLGRDHGIAVSVVSLVSSGCTEGPETVRPTPLFVSCVDLLSGFPPSHPNICLMTG